MRQSEAKAISRMLAASPLIRDRRTGQILRVVNVAMALAKGCPISSLCCVPLSDTTTKPYGGYIDDGDGPLRRVAGYVDVPLRSAEAWPDASR